MSENVIPSSLHKFNYEDKEGYTLYGVKLIKIPLTLNNERNPIEEFIKNCKDKIKSSFINNRVTVREFNYIQGESKKKDE
jgi:hypothetical protein